jgi:hypothetical protein
MPRLRIVFIMPGMEIGRAGAHGEQQGVFRIAEARAHLFLDEVQGDAVLLLQQQLGRRLPFSKYSRQVGVVMTKPKGTGRPRRVISQRLAPLPPSRSRSSLLPSENRYTRLAICLVLPPSMQAASLPELRRGCRFQICASLQTVKIHIDPSGNRREYLH